MYIYIFLSLYIVKELGGQQKIRLRLRGIGSGFKEGSMHCEYQEPLHFNVSCDSSELLRHASIRVKEHVENALSELVSAGII